MDSVCTLTQVCKHMCVSAERADGHGLSTV